MVRFFYFRFWRFYNLIGVLVLIGTNIQAQSFLTLQEHFVLDSLLLSAQTNKAEQFVYAKVNEIDSIDSLHKNRSVINEEVHQYQELFVQLHRTGISPDSSIVHKIASDVTSLEQLFIIDKAGVSSNNAYRSFNNACLANNDTMMQYYYTLARFFKLQFFFAERSRLYNSVHFAKELLSKRQLGTANFLLTKIAAEEISNPAFFELRDTIAILQAKIKNSLIDSSQLERLYNQSEEFNKHWSISAGGGILDIDNIENSLWVFSVTNDALPLPAAVKTIKPELAAAYLFEASYYFNSTMGLNIKFTKSSVHFSGAEVNAIDSGSYRSSIEKTGANFKHVYYSIESTFHYFFTSTFGVRPYIGSGIGFEFASREKTEKPINMFFWNFAENSSRKIVYNIISSEREIAKTSKIIFKVGFDFVPDSQEHFMVGSFFEEHVHFKATSLNNYRNLIYGLKAGVIF